MTFGVHRVYQKLRYDGDKYFRVFTSFRFDALSADACIIVNTFRLLILHCEYLLSYRYSNAQVVWKSSIEEQDAEIAQSNQHPVALNIPASVNRIRAKVDGLALPIRVLLLPQFISDLQHPPDLLLKTDISNLKMRKYKAIFLRRGKRLSCLDSKYI